LVLLRSRPARDGLATKAIGEEIGLVAEDGFQGVNRDPSQIEDAPAHAQAGATVGAAGLVEEDGAGTDVEFLRISRTNREATEHVVVAGGSGVSGNVLAGEHVEAHGPAGSEIETAAFAQAG
jgi:hypothetical protein